MANTGTKIVITLKEMAEPAHTATGRTKNNVNTDVNYIAPYVDLQDCPVVFANTCPVVIYTKTSTELEYEFYIPDEVGKNPAIGIIRVELTVDASVNVRNYAIPNTPSDNFIAGKFTGLDSGLHYDIRVKYINTSDAVVATCTTTI